MHKAVSLLGRTESPNYIHHIVLVLHGIWALFCWALFLMQWYFNKGDFYHKRNGKLLLYGFLIPLELTGLFMIPNLFMYDDRKNILITSGHLVVPSMGFLFIVTTYRCFYKVLKQKTKYADKFFDVFNCINNILHWIGSFSLLYKILTHMETGMAHENNIELFILTTPFAIIELFIIINSKRKKLHLNHGFYSYYLTLQLIPGSIIVVARDKYWLWGNLGITSLFLRILIENIPMLYLYNIVIKKLVI